MSYSMYLIYCGVFLLKTAGRHKTTVFFGNCFRICSVNTLNPEAFFEFKLLLISLITSSGVTGGISSEV